MLCSKKAFSSLESQLKKSCYYQQFLSAASSQTMSQTVFDVDIYFIYIGHIDKQLNKTVPVSLIFPSASSFDTLNCTESNLNRDCEYNTLDFVSTWF